MIPRGRGRSALKWAVLVVALAVTGGLGGLELLEGRGAEARDGDRAAAPASLSSAAQADCGSTVARTLARVGRNMFTNDLSGEGARATLRGLTNSRRLAAAVAAGDPVATRSALGPFIAGRLVRIRVYGAGGPLTEIGQEPSVGPVSGPITGGQGRPVGHFVMSVQGQRGFYLLLKSIGGEQVVLSEHGRRLAGTMPEPSSGFPDAGRITAAGVTFDTVSLRLRAIPGPIRVSILVPVGQRGLCGATPADTVANVVGRIATNIYGGELSSANVKAANARIAGSRAFTRAVSLGDATAVRAAVSHDLFATRLHIVRVRATLAGHLVNDVGGPYALAPVTRPLRLGGRVIGTYSFSIQDDAGFLKLMARYAHAEVTMSTAAGVVMSSLNPAPGNVPDRGRVSYLGRLYQAYSFGATRFPGGALRISLMIPLSQYGLS
jgi:hypothetical protein